MSTYVRAWFQQDGMRQNTVRVSEEDIHLHQNGSIHVAIQTRMIVKKHLGIIHADLIAEDADPKPVHPKWSRCSSGGDTNLACVSN